MMSNLKLKALKWDGKPGEPQYQLQYATSGNMTKNRAVSHDIRRALFGDCSLFIEVDSSLFTTDLGPGLAVVKAFQAYLEEQGIEFRHRSEQGPASVNFLSIVTRKSTEQHWIGTLVSAPVWQSPEFQAQLPTSGIRLYGLREQDVPVNLLDELFTGKLSPVKLLELAPIMVFDVADYGQMGICSHNFSQAELQARLDQVR